MRRQLIKRYFITGLLIWIPLAITAWVLFLIANTADQSLLLLPPALRPQNLFGFNIPGIGIAVSLFIILLTGVLTTNFIGQRLVGWWEKFLDRIPVVSSIYNSVKQVSDTLFSSSGNAFRKALLVRYPHRDVWTIAFLTGTPGGDIADYLGSDYISVYVPTTPNPTSGFFLMVKKQDVVELDMDVEKALKYIISMGVIAPPPHGHAAETGAPART
ncbi:MAG: DUF502 domain-containing protein [Candidatus Accumulibacter sp.]|nr:DUF502 domain-containing protein [Accumulibacter sp.]